MESSLLGHLPGELRNQIYQLVYPPSETGEVSSGEKAMVMAMVNVNIHGTTKLMSNHKFRKYIAFAQSCRQIRRELGTAPYAARKFRIDAYGGSSNLCACKASCLVAAVPSLPILAVYLQGSGGEVLGAIEMMVLYIKSHKLSLTLKRAMVDGRQGLSYQTNRSVMPCPEGSAFGIAIEAYARTGLTMIKAPVA